MPWVEGNLTVLAISRLNSSTSFVETANLFSYVSSCPLSSFRTNVNKQKLNFIISHQRLRKKLKINISPKLCRVNSWDAVSNLDRNEND